MYICMYVSSPVHNGFIVLPWTCFFTEHDFVFVLTEGEEAQKLLAGEPEEVCYAAMCMHVCMYVCMYRGSRGTEDVGRGT